MKASAGARRIGKQATPITDSPIFDADSSDQALGFRPVDGLIFPFPPV